MCPCVCTLQWIRNLSWKRLVWFKMTKTKVPMCANFTEKINLLQSSPWYEASVISNCKYKSQNAPWYEAGVTSWEGQAQSWEAWSSPSKLLAVFMSFWWPFDLLLLPDWFAVSKLCWWSSYFLSSHFYAIFLCYLVMIMKLGN